MIDMLLITFFICMTFLLCIFAAAAMHMNPGWGIFAAMFLTMLALTS